MNNKTIILHSKDGDIELLKELRKALISKGFADDEEWNDEREGTRYIPIQVIANDIVYLKTTLGGEVRLPVSRNDFQTMFLLY